MDNDTKPDADDPYWQQIIPINSAQATDFLKREWDEPYSLVKFSECTGLVDLVVESRRVLPVFDAVNRLSRTCGLLRALNKIVALESGPGALRALRSMEKQRISKVKDLKRAVELLEEAASLIGVRRDLFYSYDGPDKQHESLRQLTYSARKLGIPDDQFEQILEKRKKLISSDQLEQNIEKRWSLISEEPPAIVGETSEEHEARAVLNRVVNIDRIVRNRDINDTTQPDFGDSSWYWRSYLNSDKPKGGGNKASPTNLVIRMLWQEWPEELRQKVKGVWSPFITASKILNFCGHDISNKKISTYVSNAKKDAEEAQRLTSSH